MQSNNDSNIPLHCDVCPTGPSFSDVSHLLTHVASKGHLSHYYKMKVRASTDPSAKKIVDDYDEWYEENNLEDLMRERMSQKEKKRGGNNPSRRGSAATTTASARSTPSASNRGQRSGRLRDSIQLLDPQLDRRLRVEPPSRSATATPASAVSLDATSLRSFAPSMQNWTTNELPYTDIPFIKQETMHSSTPDDEDESFDFAPRRSSRRLRNNPSDSITSVLDEDNISGLVNENTKLKGILWPGMDLFDSATPEMKRKRNQKKNVSVLIQLQATSKVVAPTECVFDTTGTLRKERLITGNPDSDDSLIEGESEPEVQVVEKKRTRRRSRQALSEKNVNSGRVTRSRGQSHHPPFSRRSQQTYFDEQDEDDDLTFVPARSARRTGLSIHRDDGGPEITFDNPASMTYLTAGFRQQAHSTGLDAAPPPTQGNHISHIRQPSWGQLNSIIRSNSGGSNSTTQFHNFGHFLNQTVTQPVSTNTAGIHGYSSFPQQFGFGAQAPHNGGPLFQSQSNNTWDLLGLDNNDLSMFADGIFQGPGDIGIPNPLFFSPNKEEDDDATISATSDN